MTFLVSGIDAAIWNVIEPNLEELPSFKKLVERASPGKVVLDQELHSPLLWCGMFSGTYYDEHGHKEYMVEDEIVAREDIPVKFVWDELDKEFEVKALNIPFVVPPYSFNTDFEPVGYGLPTKPEEWRKELEKITEKTLELLDKDPDLLVTVFALLDRVQHFHWGKEKVLKWYKEMDKKVGEIVIENGFLEKKENKLIIISDHGFCSFGEARIQTLPKETPHGELKGDHHEEALVITKNIETEIREPQDVYRAIKTEIDKKS